MNTLNGVLGIRTNKSTYTIDVSNLYPSISAESIMANGTYTEIKFTKALLEQLTISKFTLSYMDEKLLSSVNEVILEDNKHKISKSSYYLKNGNIVFYLKPKSKEIYATFIYVKTVVAKSIIPPETTLFTLSDTPLNNVLPLMRHKGDAIFTNNLTIGNSTRGTHNLELTGTFNLNNIVKATDTNNLYLDANKTHIRNLDISNELIINGNTNIKGDLKLDGNLLYEGDITEIQQETLKIEKNYIILNDGIDTISTSLESGIIINRAKENNIPQEPFKIVYNDDRSIQGDYLEVGISGEQLRRVATTNATNETGAIPIWDNGYFNVNSNISVTNNDLVVNRDMRITGTIYDKNGNPIQGGVGGNGITKSTIDPEGTKGDLYFNTTQNVFKFYNNAWLNTEIGQIFSQPPPLIDVKNNSTFTHFDIEWTLPPQFPTSITSEFNFASEHSPAVALHPIINTNMVYFPIVNRICIKIFEYENDVCGNHVSYPLYIPLVGSTNSSVSQVDPSGNVIYRKGDIVAGQNGASRTGYTSITHNHLLKNSPNKIRFYRKIPDSMPTTQTKTIMPFNNPIFEMPLSRYWIEIWLENNSLHHVNKTIVIGEFQIANAPSSPRFLDTSFSDTLQNPFPRIYIDVRDPERIDFERDDDLNNIINIEKILYEWSADNGSTWYPFTRILAGTEYIKLTNGIETNIRRIDNVNTRRYLFDLSMTDMGSNLITELSKLHAQEETHLQVSIRFKNISNNNFTPRSEDNIRTIRFDKPSQPKTVSISFLDSPDEINGQLSVEDPLFVLGNTNPTLRFVSIRFEWGINDNWYPFNQINNNMLDASGGLSINRARIETSTKYDFTFNTTYLSNWTILNSPTNVDFRVSYQNKSKPIYSDVNSTTLTFDVPSIPQKNEINFSNTTSLRETQCIMDIQNPENISTSQSLYNNILRYNNIQFQWGIFAEEINWNNFTHIFDEEKKTLTNGIYTITPTTTFNKTLTFDISSSYMGSNIFLEDGSKNLLTRIRFQNNLLSGTNDVVFSEWLESNKILFEKPSIPRKNEIEYLTTITNGLTRVSLTLNDPEFVILDNADNTLNFTGLKFYWKSDKMEDWQPFSAILDSRQEEIQSLQHGEYTINYPHSNDDFTYTFDICNTYLGENASSLIDDGSKNMSVYVQYRNSAISDYSELLESNFILLEPPAQPISVDLSFSFTVDFNYNNPITECVLHIVEGSTMRTQQKDISFTGLHFQWKKNDGDWYDFSGINYNPNNSPKVNDLISLSSGIHELVRSKMDTAVYKFVVNNNYLGNDFVPMNSGDKLYTQVQYKNSVLNEFSEYQISNPLLFEEPSDPKSADLSFNVTLDVSNTRYIIHLGNPKNMLKTDDFNNSKIRLSGIGLEWGISAEETIWYGFKNISTIIGNPSNRMVNGVYLTNASFLATTSTFYFDTTEEYLDISVNEILADNEKRLVVRAKYRNTTVPEFSEYIISNDLYIDRPSQMRSITSEFFKSSTYTEAIINIGIPEYTVSGELLGNERIDLTGIRFEWAYSDIEDWKPFQKIKLLTDIENTKTDNIKELEDGVLTIQYKNIIHDISYIFDVSPEYLGEYVLYDGSSIDIRASYRNSTIGKEIIDGYNTPIDSSILFEVPSEPVSVVLDFNGTIGEYNTPITVCQIKLKDPQNTLKTENNQIVFLKDISFQWRLDDNEWNDLKKITFEDVSYDVPYVINRERDDDERTYTFEMNSDYLDNFIQPIDGSNLYVKVSYRNTILPELYGVDTSSSELLFRRPDAPQRNELLFNLTIDISNTECYINLEKPTNSLFETSNILHYTGIELKWGISGENLEWYDFSNIAITRNVGLIPTDRVENSVYLINTDTPDSILFFETTEEYLGDNISELINDVKKEMIVKARYRNSAVPDWSDDISSNPILFNIPSQIPKIEVFLEGKSTDLLTIGKIEIQKPNEFIEDFVYGEALIYMTRLRLQWKVDGDWNDFVGIKREDGVLPMINGIYEIKPIKNTNEFENYYFDICSNCLGENSFPINTNENVKLSIKAEYGNSISTGFSGDASNHIIFGKTKTPDISGVELITPKQIKVDISGIELQDIINGFGENVSTNNNAIYIKFIELNTRYQLDNEEVVDVSKIVQYDDGLNSVIYDLPKDISANELYKIQFKIRAKNNLINVWSDDFQYDNFDGTLKNQMEIQEPKITGQVINSISVSSSSNLELSWQHPTDRGALKAIEGLPLISRYDILAKVGTKTETISKFTDYNYEEDIGTDAPNILNDLDVFSLIVGSTIDELKFIDVDISQNNPYVLKQTSISGKLPFKLEQLGNPSINLSSTISSLRTDASRNVLNLSWNNPSDTGFLIGELDGNDATNAVPVNINGYSVSITCTNISSPVYKTITTNPTFGDIITALNRGQARNTFYEDRNTLLKEDNENLVYPETKYTVSLTAQNIYGSTSSQVVEEITTSAPTIPNEFKYFNEQYSLPTTTSNISTSLLDYSLLGFILNKSDPNLTTTFTTVRIKRPTDISYSTSFKTHVVNKQKLNTWIDVDTLSDNLENISYIKARQFEAINEASGNEIVYTLGSDTNLYDIYSAGATNGVISITSNNRHDIYDISYDDANRGYWWREDISYGINFANKTDNLYGHPVKLSLGIKYNNSNSTEDYVNFSFENSTTDLSINILKDTRNTLEYAYFDDLSLNAEFENIQDVSNITIVENQNAINGVSNLYSLGTINDIMYENKYKLNHYLNNYSKYFGMSGEIVYYQLVKDNSLYFTNKLASFSWGNKPDEMKRFEHHWEISGAVIVIPSITATTNNDIQIRASFRNQLTSIFSNKTLDRKLVYDKASIDLIGQLMLSDNAINVPINVSLPTGSGTLIKVPNNFEPTNPTGSTQTSNFIEEPFSDFSVYNPRQLFLYNGKFGTYTHHSFLNSDYGITRPNGDDYSYVMFKYVRDKDNASRSVNTPFKFIISFNENTDITYEDLENGNVKVFVLVKENNNDITYSSGDIGIQTRYRWILNKPRDSFTNQSVASTEISVIIDKGLGANNDTNDRFTNNNSDIGSFAGVTTSVYSNTKRNLSGVFYSSTTFEDNMVLTFYVAIGIKNSVNRYISKIHSFDVVDTTNTLGRPT